MWSRQIAIGIAIALIFPMLVNYGVSTFHPAPELQTTLTVRLAPADNATADKQQTAHLAIGQDAYDTAFEQFARVLIIVSIPLGVAAILIGAHLAFKAVGTGLIFGGILTLAWAYLSYWQYLDDWFRFLSLLAAFAILIFVGVRRTTPS